MKWIDRVIDRVFNDMGIMAIPFESRPRPEQSQNHDTEAVAKAETRALMQRLMRQP